MAKTTTGKRYRTLLEIVFLFITPVLLVYLNIVEREQYLVVALVYTSFVVVLVIREHWTLRSLHIRLDNIKKGLVPYAIFTTLGIIGIMTIASLVGNEKGSMNLYLLFLSWSLPIALVQEFLYRGFLMRELNVFHASVLAVIIINALIFAFMHAVYDPLALTLPVTFIAGIGFAWMYIKFPNLVLITISHAVLNFVALWHGFFHM
ncbi:MAG TPA: CPBP family intramembrane glutamic endopeptidase [Candidatus Paceibacterota bacterium]